MNLEGVPLLIGSIPTRTETRLAPGADIPHFRGANVPAEQVESATRGITGSGLAVRELIETETEHACINHADNEEAENSHRDHRLSQCEAEFASDFRQSADVGGIRSVHLFQSGAKRPATEFVK